MDIVNLPSLLAIPNSFGAPPSSLQVGEIVDAVVLQILESGLARLSVADGVIDVRTAVPLVPGAKVRLAVTGTSAGIQLTVLTDANASGRTVAIPAALVGRGQPVPDPASAPRALAPGPLDAGAGAAASTKAQAPIVEISVPGGSTPPPSPVSPDQPVRSPAATAALGEAVRAAATRQGGLAPLFADLAQTASPGASAQVSSIAAAAARVLALRLPLHGTLTAADVKQAVTRSGLFLEAHGYKVRVTEFTGFEHTQKNEMIFAERHQRSNPRARAAFDGLAQEIGAGPKLLSL